MLKKQENTAIRSIESLGFNQHDRLDKFLALPQHKTIEQKFEIVFGQVKPPKFSSIPNSHQDEFMPDDKELDLSGGEELSLSDSHEESPTLPVDEGMDLDSGEGLSLSDDAGELDDLSSPGELNELDGLDDAQDFGSFEEEDAPPSIDSTMTGLKLGDDLNLDADVVAKMKEIDAIMEYDATHTQHVQISDDEEDSLDMSGGDDFSEGTEDKLEFGSDDELPSESLDEDNSLSEDLQLGGDDDFGFSPMAEEDLVVTAPPAPAAKAPVAKVKSKTPPPAPPEAVFSMDNLDEDEAPLEVEPQEISFSSDNEVEVAPPPAKSMARTAAPASSAPAQSEYREVVGNYNAELERLQATLNHLRTDRESLLKKIDDFEEEKIHHQRHVLSLRAELDEKKIETQLMKKRMGEETQDLRYSLQLEQERRLMADEKSKAYQAEIQALQQKIKLEVRKVSGHERELEQQLELLKSDAETQIRHRDLKILELKRRLDAMEFDVENISSLEKKSQENKQELEVKLDKAIRTLRAAIGILEVDDPKLATLEKLKKNLDV